MGKTKVNLNVILRIVIPVIVFITLFLIGTFFDLNISKALVSGLQPGEYYTTNFVAKIVEIVGAFPIWFIGFFACLIFARFFKDAKGGKRLLMIGFIFGSFLAATLFFRDTFKYSFRFAGKEEMIDKVYMLAVYGGLGAISSAVGNFFYFKTKKEFNDKLVKMGLVILCSCAFYLLIELIKKPVGRVRYRTMNSINDFSYYVPWYQLGDNSAIKDVVANSDGFKSFPSGHTFSASMIFNITCLPYVIEKLNTKKYKIMFTAIACAYVVFVGIFRIVAGAHYFSDVVVGGGIGIGVIMLFRYLFIIRKKA